MRLRMMMMVIMLMMSLSHQRALHFVHVVFGEMLEYVANVNVFFDGRAVEPHAAFTGKGVNLLAAKKMYTFVCIFVDKIVDN